VSAGPPDSRGAAQAALDAFISGGAAISLHGGVVNGMPADGDADVTIRPFGRWDGRHFSAADWHTILIASFDGPPDVPNQQAVALEVAQTEVLFDLDGVPIELTVTPTKRVTNPERFGLTEAWGAQWGRVMAPDDLPAGEHTIHCIVLFQGVNIFENTVTIVMDPAP
jgi:hypothetical protein